MPETHLLTLVKNWPTRQEQKFSSKPALFISRNPFTLKNCVLLIWIPLTIKTLIRLIKLKYVRVKLCEYNSSVNVIYVIYVIASNIRLSMSLITYVNNLQTYLNRYYANNETLEIRNTRVANCSIYHVYSFDGGNVVLAQVHQGLDMLIWARDIHMHTHASIMTRIPVTCIYASVNSAHYDTVCH